MKKTMIGFTVLVALVSNNVVAALPEGYTQLTYLESTGTQYIDTDVVFGSTNGFSITYQATASFYHQNLCGSRVDTNDTRCLVGSNAASLGTERRSLVYIGWNGLLHSHSTFDGGWGTVSVNYLNCGRFYCRDAVNASLGTLTQQTCSFYLFAGHYDANNFPDEEIIYGYYRIFDFKMTAGTSIIMDLVPAQRDADGELGLYDLVNGVFFTNQGTGTFLPGEEVASLPSGRKAYTRLTYLESHGTEYIDTGVKFTDAHGYSITYQSTTSKNVNHNVCGSREDSGDTRCVLGANDEYAYAGWNSLVIQKSQNIADTTEGTTKVNYLNSHIADCRGTTANLGTLAAQGATFHLFAGHYAYQANVYGSYRIMAFTMTRDNGVIMDLIPARRKADGALGMYDTLNDAFYMNLGLGQLTAGAGAEELPAGYAELAYIESTGTQYIDTGIKCTSNVTIQATIYNAYSVSKHFVGARTAFKQNALGLSFQAESGSQGYAAAWGIDVVNKIVGQSLTNAVGDAFHTFSFGGKTPVLVDSQLKHVFTAQNFATDLNVYAFGVNNNGTPHNQLPSIRLSALKIYEGPTLVRDYVPMMTTNWVAGLYDLKNDVFYENAGTGVFLTGPVVRGMAVTNAVTNGSFETTDAGWTGDYTRVTSADSDVLHSTYIPDGTYVATLAAGAAITNAFTARAGRYRLAFQYMAARSGTGGKATVLLDGKTVETVTPTSIYGWVTANHDVKLAPGAHTLVCQNDGNGTICLDAVELGLIDRIPSGTMVIVK